MSYDLAEIANEEEEIKNVNGKTFKIKMLTIRQRIKLDKLLTDADKKVQKSLNPNWIEKLKNKIFRRSQFNVFDGKKSSDDFYFVKACLDFCNPKQHFTEDDWKNITTTQATKLIEIIFKTNYFLGAKNLEKEGKI